MEESTERDDTALFVLYKTGGNGMTKTISDETSGLTAKAIKNWFSKVQEKNGGLG